MKDCALDHQDAVHGLGIHVDDDFRIGRVRSHDGFKLELAFFNVAVCLDRQIGCFPTADVELQGQDKRVFIDMVSFSNGQNIAARNPVGVKHLIGTDREVRKEKESKTQQECLLENTHICLRGNFQKSPAFRRIRQVTSTAISED